MPGPETQDSAPDSFEPPTDSNNSNNPKVTLKIQADQRVLQALQSLQQAVLPPSLEERAGLVDRTFENTLPYLLTQYRELIEKAEAWWADFWRRWSPFDPSKKVPEQLVEFIRDMDVYDEKIMKASKHLGPLYDGPTRLLNEYLTLLCTGKLIDGETAPLNDEQRRRWSENFRRFHEEFTNLTRRYHAVFTHNWQLVCHRLDTMSG